MATKKKAVKKAVKKPVIKVRKKKKTVVEAINPVEKVEAVKKPLKVTKAETISPALKRKLQNHLDYIKGLPVNGMSTKRYVSEITGRLGFIKASDKATTYKQAVEYLTEKIGG